MCKEKKWLEFVDTPTKCLELISLSGIMNWLFH